MAGKCKGQKSDGEDCGAWAQAGFDYCFQHNPLNKHSRLAASSRGGIKSGARRRAKSLDIEIAVISELIDPPVEGESLELKTPEALRVFAEGQIARLINRANGNPPTTSESREIRQWSEFLLKVYVVHFHDRLEDAELKIEAINRKQLTAGGE